MKLLRKAHEEPIDSLPLEVERVGDIYVSRGGQFFLDLPSGQYRALDLYVDRGLALVDDGNYFWDAVDLMRRAWNIRAWAGYSITQNNGELADLRLDNLTPVLIVSPYYKRISQQLRRQWMDYEGVLA